MSFAWIETREGITLILEDTMPPRGATPVELELRNAGIVLASFVSFLLGDTAPPESVMDAIAVFTGEE